MEEAPESSPTAVNASDTSPRAEDVEMGNDETEKTDAPAAEVPQTASKHGTDSKPTVRTAKKTPGSAMSVAEGMEDLPTKCACEVNEDDGEMVLCEECKTWQHAVCYAYLDMDDMPKVHFCVDCAKTLMAAGGEQMAEYRDSGLLAVPRDNVKFVAIWRRTLYGLKDYDRSTITPTELGELLGLEEAKDLVSNLLQRLERNMYVKKTGKKTGNTYSIQRARFSSSDYLKAFNIKQGADAELADKTSTLNIADNPPAKRKGSKCAADDSAQSESSQGTGKQSRAKRQRVSVPNKNLRL